MNLKVLGKYGPYAPVSGATSGYLIEDKNFKMLLDMGSGVFSRLQAIIDPSELDGIFISHIHYDHTSDLLPFRYYLDLIGKKIKIYTEKSESEWYKVLFTHPFIEVINVNDNSEIEIKGHKITFYKMQHSAPDLAIKISGEKTFAYTGDTVYNDRLIPLLNGCDCALCDCAKPSSFHGPHMNFSDLKKLTELTDAKKIIVSHFSPNVGDLSEFRSLSNVVLADENKTYEI